ncbi:MAG: PucR family transcriptional regulator [Solirubrobacteraceae bacterium]
MPSTSRPDPVSAGEAPADAPSAQAPGLKAIDVDEQALASIGEAVEAGAGLPEVARAVARALDASLAVSDARGVTVAVAARSPADERALQATENEVRVMELRLEGSAVGILRIRLRRAANEALLGLIAAVLAGEVGRQRLPDRVADATAVALFDAMLGGEPYDVEQSRQHTRELAIEVESGVSVIVARAHPQTATAEGWRERARVLCERGARAVAGHAIAALPERPEVAGVEVAMLVPGSDEQLAGRAAEAVLRELEAGLSGCSFAVGRSRVIRDHSDLARAASEALLAANVAEGEREARILAFEETGAYRLLLSTMSENPTELRRFYEETVEPVAAYDEQYETELVRTLSTFLEADGNVAGTAQRLYTHRHTIYYRLERVRELSGLDVSSSDGREKLSLGLKAMRVLGISASSGPATEMGAVPARTPASQLRGVQSAAVSGRQTRGRPAGGGQTRPV